MSENKFDQVIADHIGDIEMPYEPASWDVLQSKMNQLSAPTQAAVPDTNAFDQRMRAMLEEVDIPYQSAHWAQMAQKLDHSGSINRIKKYKIAEAVIMVLLVVNLQSILNNGRQWFHMPRPQEEQEQTPDMAAKSLKKTRQQGTGTIASAIVAPGLLPTMPLAASVQQYTTSLANDKALATTQSLLSSAIVTNTTILTPSTINSALLGAGGQPIPRGLRPLTLLAALGLDKIEQLQPVTPPMAGLIMPVEKTTKQFSKPSKTYAMAYGGTERHMYNGTDNYATQFYTASAGIRAGKRTGKWGLEGGLEYTPTTFRPENDIVGFYKKDGRVLATQYDRVRATLVSVPARVTRQIARAGKTSLHAVAGFTAHFATNKSYDYEEVEYVNAPSSAAVSTSQPATPNANGILEGSALYGNSYLTADAGMRVEHRLNNRMAAYIEPQYRRFANGRGVGPNKGKNNALGVQAGVIAMIN